MVISDRNVVVTTSVEMKLVWLHIYLDYYK
jgi:hypothetical protein